MKQYIITGILLLMLSSLGNAANFKTFSGATPALELNDLQGQTHSLSDYKGKLVLVQFWATYCTPCRKEMPSMNRLQEKMGEEFKILAVNMGESRAEVDKFVQEVGPEFTVLLDESGQSIATWKAFAAPANFLIDRDGNIQYTLYGAVEWDSDEILEKLRSL